MNIKRLFIIMTICSFHLRGIMKLTSPSFDHNGTMPSTYTCDGSNISPALKWTNAPQNTKSFVLIVDDPDASSAVASVKEKPAKVWVHWILLDIPSNIDHLAENLPSSDFKQGSTDFNGKQQWGGPCPPSGTHHYQFTLYALDIMLNLPAGTSKEELIAAMNGHILEQTTLIGTYQRKSA
jgi:Raf kinase inhibitor-like YbhB/YbcL family protein